MSTIPVSDGGEEQKEVQGAEESAAADLESRVAELEAEIESLKEGRLRAIADMENARRRAQQDVLSTVQYANADLLKKLLPILDDFHRSIESSSETKDFEAFFKGIELIRDNFSKVLVEVGVERIETIGKPFDVEFHEALMQQPSDKPEGTVLAELEPGYVYKDRVIRHARVIVAA
jgi:molecular chaperone GrpE